MRTLSPRPTRSRLATALLLSLPLAAFAAGTSSSGSSASGTSSSGSAASGASTAAGGSASSGAGDAKAGEKLFTSAAPPCSTCHSTKAGVKMVGPSLAGIAAKAKQIVSAKDYKGQAKDAKGYIRESIVNPNAYVVPGFGTGGQSLMPNTFGQTLKPQQIDDLVAYLMTLK